MAVLNLLRSLALVVLVMLALPSASRADSLAIVAQNFLDSVFAAPTGFSTANAAGLETARGQDQIIPAPEPATFFMMGVGLAAVWRAARPKRGD
jgi:hypothetical protein